MDNIKNLISLSNKSLTDNEKYLSEAYKLLNGLISKRNINESIETATEICVILAESCNKNNKKSLANNCVKLFFSLDPPENQYLARAYIVQAQLIQPTRFDDINTLEKPIGFILKAINFSKKEKQFHYLVYNSSLVYYEIVRNFLRPSNYLYLCKSLGQVCKALEDVNDSNMEWRSQLLLLLLQGHIDAGHRKEVIQHVDATATFIGKHAPYLLKELLILLINNGVGTNEKYLWYTKNNPHMQVFVRICKLRIMKDKDSENSFVNESRKLFALLIGAEDTPSSFLLEDSQGTKSEAKGRSSIQINAKKLTIEQRCSLLLELAKVCLQKISLNDCRQCVDKVKQMCSEEMTETLQEAEFINSELVVMESDSTSETMTASSLKLRMSTIEKCRLTLQNSIRAGNNRLMEFGCVTLWNLCLPILQPSLRDKIGSHLILIADSLENIGCLNYKFSCQVHIEVGKYFAASEQAKDAIVYFQKAQLLDKTGEYLEMIDHFINKIKMKEKLYEKPSDSCDIARQLIEQVQSTLKIAKISMTELRPLLAQIGHCLAPDDFLVLLEHDLSVEEITMDNIIESKASKTLAWESILTRLNSYLKRSGDINDRVKMTLWGDLVKLARSTQLWDICRVASCFAVLYDDGRWKNHFQVKVESSSRKGQRGTAMNANQASDVASSVADPANIVESEGMDPVNGDGKSRKKEDSDLLVYPLLGKANRFDKFLIEMIADIYVIKAEAFIQAVRNEGAQLFTFPQRPRDFKKHPKGYTKDTTKEDCDWQSYCQCLQRMSESIVNCFIRSASLATELQAPWLLQNAATYLWNYSIHVISLSDHGILVPCFQTMFDFMRPMINEKMVDIITQYGVILAHGMIQKMIPTIPMVLDSVFDTPAANNMVDKKTKKGKESPKLKSSGTAGLQNQVDAVAQYKKALDICQYLMDITADVAPVSATETTGQAQSISSTTSKPLPLGKPIGIKLKCQLIEMWVQCKQMLQQGIGTTFGTDDVDNKTGQRAHVRAITSVQMLWISQNELYKFSEAANVDECIQMVETADWWRPEVALQLLTKLCFVAMNTTSINTVSQVNKVAETARRFCSTKEIGDRSLALSYITFCQGISLHKNSSPQSAILIQCLKLLVQACCYAKEAKNYFLVSQISHYFWNIAQIIIHRFSGGTQITNEIDSIINCLVSTVDKKRFKLFFESHTEEELPRIEFELEEKVPHNIQYPDDQKLITVDFSKTLFQSSYRRSMSKTSLEQDLVLRIQMYIALYQNYFSQERWTEALKVLDNAISELPRTNHRIELFRHRVLIKVRLDLSIELDIQKFKNQQENEIALLWREVAIWSKTPTSQLNAYQKAIEVLKMRENDWLKAELVNEMSQWMLHYNYPIEACNQLIEWAIDILLNVEFKKEMPATNGSATKNKTRSASSKKSKLKINTPIEEQKESKKPADPEFVVEILDGDKMTHGVSLQPTCPTAIVDLSDIHQLSALVISYVFRANIVGPSDSQFKESLVMATTCISRMWTVSMKNVAVVVKEISKTKSETELPSKGKDKKEKNVKVEQEQVKSKVLKRKGPIDWIPTSYEDWAIFEVSDDVLEALKSTSYMPLLGINEHSVKNMGDFVTSCDSLVGLLEEYGYELLAFPVLSLLDAVSRSSDTVPAKVMNQYVHIRSLKIALKLNMTTASLHHEKFVDSPSVLPDCVSYTALLKSTIEEYKVNHALLNKSTKFPQNFDASPKTYLNIPHLSRKRTTYGYVHETWIKLASILIHLGYNKEAAEVIHEATKISELLEDEAMLIDISLLKTRLYLNQGEIDSALMSLDDVENRFSIFSLNQWREIVNLLLDIGNNTCNQRRDVDMMGTRLTRLREHTEKRLGKMDLDNQQSGIDLLMVDIMLASVLTENHLLELELNEDENYIAKGTEIVRRLLSIITHLDNIAIKYENLTNIPGLTKVLNAKVNIYDKALKLLDSDNGKIVILKKLKTIEDLLRIQLIKFVDSHAVCSDLQGHSYSLIIDRKLARTKLLLVDCLITIYTIAVEKKVTLTLEHRRKNELKQIVDEYVADSVPDDEMPDWREALSGISERILSTLSDANSLCRNIPDLNAQVLSRYGHVLKLRAMEIHPMDEEQWKHSGKGDEALKQIDEDIDTTKVDLDSEEELEMELSPMEYRRKIIQAQIETNLLQSQDYLTQATELLNQAINLSINCQDYNVTSYAVELLMDILGQFEAGTTAQLLCLYQSCRASIQLRHRLSTTLRQASMGQLAALVQQHNYMVTSSQRHDSNLTSSSLFRSVVEKLNNTFSAWRVTNVTLNQSDLLKDMSSICNGFCLIQHSSDSNFIYAAFIDAKQKINTIKQGNKPSTADKTAICRMRTSTQYTKSLVKTWKSFKIRMENAVFDIENRRSINHQKTQLYTLINNQSEMERSLDEKDQMEADIDQNLLELESQFSEMSQQLSDYVAPLLEQLAHLLPSAASRNSSSHQKTATQSSTSKDSIVLLIDDIVACTSIESVKYLRCPLSRDFSLQILHHRYKGNDKSESNPNETVQATDSGKKKDKSKTPHRIPALREVNKKSTKILPLNRQIPIGALPMDTHQIRYIVDPHLDANAVHEQSLSVAFRKELSISSLREQQITPRWIGLIGDDICPSLEELELYLKDASSVMYLNTENLVSLMTPQRIAMLNAAELQLIICLDRINNRALKDRIVQKARSKSHIDIASEDPVAATQLMTLAGARSILANQCNGLLNWNLMALSDLFTRFLDDGMTLCESVYSMRHRTEQQGTDGNENISANHNDRRDGDLRLRMYNPVIYGLANLVLNGSS